LTLRTSFVIVTLQTRRLKVTHPQFKELRRSYGFDEVAIVPGDVTINPEQTDIGFKIGEVAFKIPVVASAMDAVTDVKMAVRMSQLGGLAVLHGEGIQARPASKDLHRTY
jgi:IMP dehydrogenase